MKVPWSLAETKDNPPVSLLLRSVFHVTCILHPVANNNQLEEMTSCPTARTNDVRFLVWISANRWKTSSKMDCSSDESSISLHYDQTRDEGSVSLHFDQIDASLGRVSVTTMTESLRRSLEMLLQSVDLATQSDTDLLDKILGDLLRVRGTLDSILLSGTHPKKTETKDLICGLLHRVAKLEEHGIPKPTSDEEDGNVYYEYCRYMERLQSQVKCAMEEATQARYWLKHMEDSDRIETLVATNLISKE